MLVDMHMSDRCSKLIKRFQILKSPNEQFLANCKQARGRRYSVKRVAILFANDRIFFFFNQAYFEGYTELLGISTYCRLNFTMSRMELLIQGNFLGIIKAELFLTASYSLTFASSQFYVKVTVDLSGINDVRKKLFLL